MRLLVGKWGSELKRLLRESCNQVTIVTPFVTGVAPNLLRPIAEGGQVKCRLITRLNLNDFRSGVSDLRALKELVEMGVLIKTLKGLHAKVYVFDNREAVVTSANFTGGGLANQHEWGVLVGRAECVEVFDQADVLWDRLTRSLNRGDFDAIERTLEEYGRTHPVTEIDEKDILPDLGETPSPHDAELEITLTSGTSAAEIEAEIQTIVAADPRFGNNNEHTHLMDDLRSTGGRSISIRSFLWLVGWSNTGGNYGPTSNKHVRPLMRSMFGYVPARYLNVEGRRLDLKNYRYNSPRFKALDDQIVAGHQDHLGVGG